MADVLASLDAIPADQIPAAIARLAARAMEPPPVHSHGDEPDDLLTPDEVAALLRSDTRFVYRHADEIGAVRLSRRKLRFRRSRVLRYLERR